MMTKETKDLDVISKQELADIDAQIAAMATSMQTVLASKATGNNISTQGGKFTLPDKTIMPNPMRAVILGYVQVNTYYEQAFNPKSREKNEPRCQAVALIDTPEELVKPKSTIENPICDNCKACDFNQWESDPQGGKGKACKNTYRAAVILPDVSDSDVYHLNISVTATKNWDTGCGEIIRNFGGLVKAVSHITFDTSTGYNRVSIATAEPNDQYAKHFAHIQPAMEALIA